MSAPPLVEAALDDPAARDAYTALLAASPTRTVFARLDVAEAVANAFGMEARLLGVPGERERWSAGHVAFFAQRGPLRVAALPPFVQYLAPVLAGPLDPAAVHAHASPLDGIAQHLEARSAQASLRLPAAFDDLRPLAWRSWTLQPQYTFVSDLVGDPLAAWSASARRTCRKHRDAYTVTEEPDALDEAIATVQQAHDYGHDAATLRELFRPLTLQGTARVVLARRDGRAEAALVALSDGVTAHYTLAGSQPGPAMTVLLGTLLPRLAEAGVQRFDWAGANTPSIAEFKRRLGGQLAPVTRARIVTHPALRLAQQLRGDIL